jgi:hypothetical protein
MRAGSSQMRMAKVLLPISSALATPGRAWSWGWTTRSR